MTAPKISRVQSFRCAFSGIGYTLRTQRNAQIHVTIALLIGAVGLLIQISLMEWAIIVLTMGFVIVAETFNTALEVAMDHLAPDIHPQVKIIKDVAAGAVLLAAITAALVGLLIFGPPLWAMLFGR